MDLPSELSEIVREKVLWTTCAGYFPYHLVDAKIKAVKQRGWLHILEYDSESVYWAINKADIQILDWIADHTPIFYENFHKFKNFIIEKGYLEIFKWLVQTYPYRLEVNFTFRIIGSWGQIGIAEWYYDNVTNYFPTSMYEGAASEGHIDFLKWAFEKASYYIAVTVTACSAASNDRIEILEWLFKEYGEFHWTVRNTAVLMKQDRVLEWFAGKRIKN